MTKFPFSPSPAITPSKVTRKGPLSEACRVGKESAAGSTMLRWTLPHLLSCCLFPKPQTAAWALPKKNVQPVCVSTQHARCNGGNLGWVPKSAPFQAEITPTAPHKSYIQHLHIHIPCTRCLPLLPRIPKAPGRTRSREGEAIARSCWGHKAGVTKRGQLGVSAGLQK